mgnify:CR=1 FL=1
MMTAITTDFDVCYTSGSNNRAFCLLLTGKDTDSTFYHGFGSQYKEVCLLLTGNNRQKSLNLLYLQKLISRMVGFLNRINTAAIINFCAAREAFCVRTLGLKYQAKTGKINRQITGISGKNREVTGKN